MDQIYCYRQGRQRHLVRVSCGIEKCDHHVARPVAGVVLATLSPSPCSALGDGGGGRGEAALGTTGRDRQASTSIRR